MKITSDDIVDFLGSTRGFIFLLVFFIFSAITCAHFLAYVDNKYDLNEIKEVVTNNQKILSKIIVIEE